MSAGPSVEEDEGAILRYGENALAELSAFNEKQLQDVAAKLKEYDNLVSTLKELPQKTSHQILMPVCGGLAFFDARIVHTNEIMVLLGDNWFAERSAAQAVEIAHRRIAFLQREKEVLDIEHQRIAERLKLLGQQQQEEVSGAGGGTSQEACDSEDELTAEDFEELEREMGENVWSEEAVDNAIREKMKQKQEKRLSACAQPSSQDKGSPPPLASALKTSTGSTKVSKTVQFATPASIEPYPQPQEQARKQPTPQNECPKPPVEDVVRECHRDPKAPSEGRKPKKSLFRQQQEEMS